ncbi:MAG: VWA domain-containing protein [Taibaiella sp.]|nr:VWA domain-containing protein [Taibaiella sp.]
MINSFLQKYNLIFAQPFWLWLLLLIPVYLVLRGQWRKKNDSYWLISNLPQKFVTKVPLKIRLRPILQVLRTLTLIGIIIALARPQKTDSKRNIDAEGIDIMLSIDISGSMMDKDFEPNRLEAAKKTMKEFVQGRTGDRMGLVIFAGESFTLCPVTLDHSILLQQISILQSDMLEAGTSIGNGLASALNGLRSSDSKTKIIVLMTDGVNQPAIGLNIKPDEAIEMAKLYQIKVYTIGIGSQGKALRPTPQPDGSVVDVLADVEIDEVLLQKIAKETGGEYFRATSNTSLDEIYSEIDKLEKSKVEMSAYYQYEDVFYWFLIPALIILVLELLLRYTYFRTITEE